MLMMFLFLCPNYLGTSYNHWSQTVSHHQSTVRPGRHTCRISFIGRHVALAFPDDIRVTSTHPVYLSAYNRKFFTRKSKKSVTVF